MRKTMILLMAAAIILTGAACSNMTESAASKEIANTPTQLITMQPTAKPTEELKEEISAEAATPFIEQTVSPEPVTYAPGSLLVAPLTKEISLLEDRLLIMMPESTENDILQQGVMYAPESNREQMSFSVEQGGEQIDLYVKETFCLSSGDMQKDAADFTRVWFKGYLDMVTPSIGKSESGADIIRVTPHTYYTEPETVLVDSAFVMSTDNTLIFVGIYMTKNLLEDEKQCAAKADEIIQSLRLGTREIGKAKEDFSMAYAIKISIEEGYVMAPQYGVDFDVYHIKELSGIDDDYSAFNIYMGWYPSCDIAGVKKGDEGYVFKEDNVLGKDILYVGTDEGDGYYWQSLFSPNDDMLSIHIFFFAENDEEFEKIAGMIRTMKFSPN